MSGLVASEGDLDQTLQTVVDLTVGTLPGCDSAGVTLKKGDGGMTAAGTDAFTLEIDKIQYSSGEGPCLQAMNDQEKVEIEAVSQESRWPEFTRRAQEAGFRSSLSFPLQANGSVGALNIYSKTERAFDDESRMLGDIYAKQASIALKNAITYSAAKQLTAQLEEAVASRDLIGQAKGILMERESMTDEEAFQMMVAASQAANIKVKEIALRLVEEKRRSSGDRE